MEVERSYVFTMERYVELRCSKYIGKFSLGIGQNIVPVNLSQLKLNLHEFDFNDEEEEQNINLYVAVDVIKKPAVKKRRRVQVVHLNAICSINTVNVASLFPQYQQFFTILRSNSFRSTGLGIQWSQDEHLAIWLHVVIDEACIYGDILNAPLDDLCRYQKYAAYSHVLQLTHPDKLSLVSSSDVVDIGRENFEEFFDLIKEHRTAPPRYNLRLDGLTATLRHYQEESVRFMIHRERVSEINCSEAFESIRIYDDLYYYPLLRTFCHKPFDLNCCISGGILAEEMGLGKTVEILALVLSHAPESSLTHSLPRIFIEGEENHEQTFRNDPVDADVSICVENIVSLATSQAHVDPSTTRSSKSKKGRKENPMDVIYYNARPVDNWSESEVIRCVECGMPCIKTRVSWTESMEPYASQFNCPYCIPNDKDELLNIGATLIVLPDTICSQWYDEIKRHVRDDVVIDIYRGVRKDGYKHPLFLNNCNLVLVTYEVLKSELNYVCFNNRTVGSKRKAIIDNNKLISPSPLLAVNWWRVCMDESQLVEGSTGRAAQLCSSLHARHRWCVTGTPLIHSVNDLGGLMNVLQVWPWCNADVWRQAVWAPYTRGDKTLLVRILSQLFWRNSKKDVQNQLRLPQKIDRVHYVTFSPLEGQIYMDNIREARVAINSAFQYIEKNYIHSSNRIFFNQMSQYVWSLFMKALDKLRLSIVTGGCHKGGVVRARRAACKTVIPLSLKMIFLRLFNKTKQNLAENYRQLISYHSGQAGLYLLFSKWPYLGKLASYAQMRRAAIVHYGQCLHLMSELEFINSTLGMTSQSSIAVDEDVDQDKENSNEDQVNATSSATEGSDCEVKDGVMVPNKAFVSAQSFENQLLAVSRKSIRVDSTQTMHVAKNLADVLNSQKDLDLLRKRTYEYNHQEPSVETIPLSEFSEDLKQQVTSSVRRFLRNDLQRMEDIRVKWARNDEDWRTYDKTWSVCLQWIVVILDRYEQRFPVGMDTSIRMREMHMQLNRIEKKESSIYKFTTLELLPRFLHHADMIRQSLQQLQEAFQHWFNIFSNTNLEDYVNCQNKDVIEMVKCGHNKDLVKVLKKEEENIAGRKRGLVLKRKVFEESCVFLRFHCPLCRLNSLIHKIQLQTHLLNMDGTTDSLWFSKQCHNLFNLGEMAEKSAMNASFGRMLRVCDHLVDWLQLAKTATDQTQEILFRLQEMNDALRRFEFGMTLNTKGRSVLLQAPDTFYVEKTKTEERDRMSFAVLHSLRSDGAMEMMRDRDRVIHRLKYLQSLNQSDSPETSERKCPVCWSAVTIEWRFFPCAHIICNKCFQEIIRRVEGSRKRIKCVVCREETLDENVLRVVLQSTSLEADHFVKKRVTMGEVRLGEGLITVKFEAVLTLLNEVIEADGSAKIIVFSSLEAAFKPFEHLLKSAKVPFVSMRTAATRKINQFKNDPNIKVLLTPLWKGANGLNLTQANHVFFLEPVTETSVLEQAVGRMNRMGQKREMTVHQFVVSGTVEEEIWKVAQSGVQAESWTVETIADIFDVPCPEVARNF